MVCEQRDNRHKMLRFAACSNTDVFLFAIAILVYLNALSCELAFDDLSAITRNPDLRPAESSLWDLFQHDFWVIRILVNRFVR